MSTLLKMISSTIDDLRSKLDLEFSHELEAQISKTFGLSQQLEMQTFTKILDSQLTHINLQQKTSNTSIENTLSQANKLAPKKKRKKANT
jgi:hypothetical protein